MTEHEADAIRYIATAAGVSLTVLGLFVFALLAVWIDARSAKK